MSHKWIYHPCPRCNAMTLEKTCCYICKITYPKVRQPRVKKFPETKGLSIQPFSNIGSKY